MREPRTSQTVAPLDEAAVAVKRPPCLLSSARRSYQHTVRATSRWSCRRANLVGRSMKATVSESDAGLLQSRECERAFPRKRLRRRAPAIAQKHAFACQRRGRLLRPPHRADRCGDARLGRGPSIPGGLSPARRFARDDQVIDHRPRGGRHPNRIAAGLRGPAALARDSARLPPRPPAPQSWPALAARPTDRRGDHRGHARRRRGSRGRQAPRPDRRAVARWAADQRGARVG